MGLLIFVWGIYQYRITKLYVSNGPCPLPFPITDQSIILQKGGGFWVFMILDLLSLVSKKINFMINVTELHLRTK
jgi:hypothetical protein